MKCVEFEREWQELDDPGLFSPGMEDHLGSCAQCAKLVREVNRLRWEARQLMEAEQPPARLWANIRSELSRDGVLRQPAQSWLQSILTFAWVARLPMGVAYASVFVLALVGVEFIRDQVTPPSAAPAVASAPAPSQTLGADAAQERVASAAPAREEEQVIQKAIEKAPPERQAILVRNWQQIDSSVGELQRFRDQHPNDLEVLLQLHQAQEQQRQFFEQLMRWEMEDFNAFEATVPR